MRFLSPTTVLLPLAVALMLGGCLGDLEYAEPGSFDLDLGFDFDLRTRVEGDQLLINTDQPVDLYDAAGQPVDEAYLAILWHDEGLDQGQAWVSGFGHLVPTALTLASLGSPVREGSEPSVLVAEVLALDPSNPCPLDEVVTVPPEDQILARFEAVRIVYVPAEVADEAPGFPVGYSCAVEGAGAPGGPLTGLVWADCAAELPASWGDAPEAG